MKALILISILTPFFSKRTLPESLCTMTLFTMPLIWSSWELPEVFNMSFMSDKVSCILIILSMWMAILMSLMKSSDKFLNLNIALLLMCLSAFFLVSSLLYFFILFEASLIPTLCLIMGWGYQPERLEASYYFVFYTITFSIPLLISLLWLMKNANSKYFLFDTVLYQVCSGALGLLMLLVFMIKLPLFMTHFWLPKAHVEAPVVGSMILAGILLKTGGYGVLRIYMYMSKSLVSLSFLILSLVGMVYVCLVCLYCMDLKQMIAYSSVSHMNFMLVGLMNTSLVSVSGSIIMMVAHGLCSSLMFMLVDLSYKRCSSRSVLLNKGLLMITPCLSMLWSLTILFNMGIPPTSGNISELLIISASSKSILEYLMFGGYLFLSAFYSVYIYMVVNHGNSSHLTAQEIQVKEIFMGLAHLLPLSSLTLLLILSTL